MIIFLDFDGVLHPDAVYRPRNKPLQLRAAGELFMHASILEDALSPYPQAKVVLSTSWVKVLGYDRTVKKMPLKLAERVIGATWHDRMNEMGRDPFDWMTRYQQIEAHVMRNAVEKWIAIDDLHSGKEDWPACEIDKLVLTRQDYKN